MLAGYRFETTVDYVLFGAEELGLYGSSAYVNDAERNEIPIQGAIILDMVGYYDTIFGVTLETERTYEPWADQAARSLEDWTELAVSWSFNPFGSDHMPFIDAGIPAYLIIETDWEHSPYYHTADDTFANVHSDLGFEVAEAVAATVLEAARVVEAPE